MGNSALFYEAARRKCAPRWRAPARILYIDKTGAAVKFQSQTQQVARYCARKKVEGQDIGEVGRGPGTGPTDPWDGVSTEDRGRGKKHGKLPLQESGEPGASSTTLRQDIPDVRVRGSSSPSPEANSMPDPPTFCPAPVAAIPFDSATAL